MSFFNGLRAKARSKALAGEIRGGQGTTEYAVLIAVLVIGLAVVIALFRDQLGDIWTAATTQLAQDANTVVGGGGVA